MSKEQFLKENLRPGELYAGLLLGQNGEPDQQIFLLPGDGKKVTWADGMAWAERAGGFLPTRREQSLLFANLKEQFKPERYWSGTQYAGTSYYAWFQYFSDGLQSLYHKSSELRVRAVRRLAI